MQSTAAAMKTFPVMVIEYTTPMTGKERGTPYRNIPMMFFTLRAARQPSC
jgi:hypothetical protein